MATTILDIAKASGKSYPTVSRALNDHPKISVKTKEHIRKVAAELNYRPSFAGTALKKGCTGILVVIVPDLADPFYSEFISNFKKEAHTADYDVVVYDYEMNPDLERRCLERMLSGCCDGGVAFITSFKHTSDLVGKIWNARIPLIAVGTRHQDNLHYDHVAVDMRESLKRIFAQLKRKDKTELAFITSNLSDEIFANVYGYMKVLLEHCKVELDLSHVFRSKSESSCQALNGLLAANELFAKMPSVKIILAWNGYQGYGIIQSAIAHGRKISKDLVLIVRDDTWISRYSTFPIHAIDQRLDLVAKECFSAINKRLKSINAKEEWSPPIRKVILAEPVFHKVSEK
jgi:LacI family transcriptional regulator